MTAAFPEFDPDFASPSDWAAMYRLDGLQIVPAKMPVNGSQWKMPALTGWAEFQENLIPDAVFLRWYGQGGEHLARQNMGILTGRCSGNVFVLDLDVHKHPEAGEWWRGALAIHNSEIEPETVQQRTGGGGRQLLFRAPADWVAPTNRTNIGVDIRGQGGFAMMPPSQHESGSFYAWETGSAPWEIEIAVAPEWLLEAIETLIARHGSRPKGVKTASPDTGKDPFGRVINGREGFMRDRVWHAALELYRQCQIPFEHDFDKAREELWASYEREVVSRLEPRQDAQGRFQSNAELLGIEHRGYVDFCNKWRRAIKKWGTPEFVEAANKPKPEPEPELDKSGPVNSGISGPAILKLEWMDLSGLDRVPKPLRKWAIRDMVPLNQVGLFSGEGGTGKSIIELMKDVAHVTGKDWMGAMPEQGGAFYLGAEDEAEEIHIRLHDILRSCGVTFAEVSAKGLKILPLLGQDSMLCVPSGLRGNHIVTTPLYKLLLEAAGDLKPKNISIDTLSRAFGGDEINRVQVYAFAMHMQAVAKAACGSVTILSHPSLAGMASGSGISGSTAWHGAFRFRQYLKGVIEDEDAEDDLRELQFKKNQYGPKSRPVILQYKDGIFKPLNSASDPERLARERRVDGMFVNLLRKVNSQGDRVTHMASSPHYYAPKVFSVFNEARVEKVRIGEFEDAMRRLMDSNRVLVEISGKDSRKQSRLILSPGS